MRPDNTTAGLLVMDDNPFVHPLNPQSSPSHYSAWRMTKPITFFYRSSHARTIFVTGDFNEWHPTSHPMQRQPDGDWLIQIPLPHGHHRYVFLVDGKPTLDPRAMGTDQGPHIEKVSLVAVS